MLFRLLTYILVSGFCTEMLWAQSPELDQAWANVEKAEAFFQSRQIDSARLYYQLAAQAFEQENIWDRWCRCQTQLAYLLNLESKWQASSDFIKQYEPICMAKLGRESEEVADIYGIWAVNTIYLGAISEAKTYFRRSLEIFKILDPQPIVRLSNAHVNMANLYARLGDFDSASIHYQAGIDLILQMEERPAHKLGSSYHNLGQFYLEQGKYQEAIEVLEKAFEYVRQSVGDSHEYAIDICISLGVAHGNSGDWGQARVSYQNALTLIDKNPLELNRRAGLAQQNMATTYHELREWESAIFHQTKALEHTKQVYGDLHLRTASSYNTLGSIYSDKGDIQEAIKMHNRSMQILEHIEDTLHPTAANILFQVANSYQSNDLGQKAIQIAERAMSWVRLFYGDQVQPSIARELPKLIKLYVANDMEDKALQLCQEGYQAILPDYHSDNPYDHPDSAQSLANAQLMRTLLDFQAFSMEVLAEKGKLPFEKALSPALLALQAMDVLEQRYLSPHGRRKAQSQIIDVYSMAIRLLYASYQESGNRSYLEQAFLLADQSKSRMLQLFLNDIQAQKISFIPDSLLDRERQLRLELDVTEKKLFDEKEYSAPDSNRLDILKRKENQLLEERRQLILQLEHNYPAYHQLKYQLARPSLEEVRSQLKRKESQIISFHQGKKHLFLFGLSKDGLIVKKQDWGFNEQTSLQEFLGNIQNRTLIEKHSFSQEYMQSFSESAFHWYSYLLEPILFPESKQLRIIPDGILGQLPFELLLMKKPQAKESDYRNLAFLLRDKSVSYGFNVALESQAFQRNVNSEYGYLGIAPSYLNPANQHSKDEANALFAKNRDAFGPLAYNQEEIQTAASIWDGKALLGKEASKSRFLSEASTHQILHIASHAFTNDQHPLYGGLVFGDTEQEVLEAFEIYQLQLQADLTILSACNTGLGKWQRGEGIMSLARAFRYAGCPSITMSLWSADDASTSLLMQGYLRYLKDGLAKDEALRLAKLDYLASAPQTHPFFWAAFVQTGDISPLGQAKSMSFWLWIMGIVGIILLILLVSRKRLQG